MLGNNEPEDKYFTKEEPDPPPQTLKLFVEYFIARSRETPLQSTVLYTFSCLLSEWEKETLHIFPESIKNDINAVSCTGYHEFPLLTITLVHSRCCRVYIYREVSI